MPNAEQLRLAMEEKSPSGFPAFTTQQLTDKVIEEDSFMGKKIHRAMEMGVTREQALRFYSYGNTGGQLPEPKKTGFFDRIVADVKSRSANVGAAFERQSQGEQGLGSTALQVAGEATGLAFGDMPGRALEKGIEATPDAIKEPVKAAGIAVLQTKAGQAGIQALTKGMEAYESWKVQNPVDAENLESIVNIGAALPVGAIATKGVKAGASAAKGTVKAAGEMVAKRLRKTPDEIAGEIEGLVGQIVQGNKTNIENAKRALRLIDTEGIESYDELSEALTNKITALSRKQDEILQGTQVRKPLNNFTRTAKSGGREASANPVASTFDHLEELYQKTGQPEELVRIQNLRDRAKTEGLTAKEVNDLAREYGIEFKKQAFSKTGDPLTSVNAKLHENTRIGVKNAARGMLPNDASKLIDEEMSAIFDTRQLTEKMALQAQKLANRIEKRNLAQKLGAGLGNAIDLMSGRSLSSLFTSMLIRGNIGLKALNAVQIQDLLSKRLDRLMKLLDKIDGMTDDQALKAIDTLIAE